MKPKLIPNWKAVLTRSYSMIFTYLGIGILLGPEAMYAVAAIEVNPYAAGYADLAAGILVVLGRVVDQGMGDSDA
jgi:hypothetical protein